MANNYILQNFMETAEGWGLTDVLLPFLLIFIIVFAIMQKTRILGENKKNLNVAFAVILGLLVVIPHVTRSYPAGLDVVVIINSALPTVSIILVAVVMLLILIGLFGGEVHLLGVALSNWITFLSIIVIAWVFFGAAYGWRSWDWLKSVFSSEAMALIVIILVFGIIIAFISGGDEDREKRKSASELTQNLRNVFGGGGGHH